MTKYFVSIFALFIILISFQSCNKHELTQQNIQGSWLRMDVNGSTEIPHPVYTFTIDKLEILSCDMLPQCQVIFAYSLNEDKQTIIFDDQTFDIEFYSESKITLSNIQFNIELEK